MTRALEEARGGLSGLFESFRATIERHLVLFFYGSNDLREPFARRFLCSGSDYRLSSLKQGTVGAIQRANNLFLVVCGFVGGRHVQKRFEKTHDLVRGRRSVMART